MRKHLSTRIEIHADADRVWQVLTDFAGYAEWNPFILQAEGEPRPGHRLVLRMQPAGGRAATFRPTVLEARPPSRLRWLGRLGLPGLLDADHTFAIDPLPGGGVVLRQEEEFRGAVVPFLARSLDRGTLPAFAAMNEALKHRAEADAIVC
jgi:hypothetical protein